MGPGWYHEAKSIVMIKEWICWEDVITDKPKHMCVWDFRERSLRVVAEEQ